MSIFRGCARLSGSERPFSAVSMPTEEEPDGVFERLADRGQVQMPLTKTFGSPWFGMVTDRFGLAWMIIVPAEPAEH